MQLCMLTCMWLLQIAFVLVVIGFSYLSVPLYRVFCQVTGFGGRTTGDERSERKTSRIQIHEDA